MNILIVYGTIEGQTGKIARFARDRLQAAGHEVALLDSAADPVPAALDGVDKVILAASVHERRHPEAFEAVVAAKAGDLAGLDTLLISVSLSAAFPTGLDEAAEYVYEMASRTGVSPGATLLVAGAVRPSGYDYFATQVVQHVVLRDQADVQPHEEHEFTDWEALAKGLDAFVAA